MLEVGCSEISCVARIKEIRHIACGVHLRLLQGYHPPIHLHSLILIQCLIPFFTFSGALRGFLQLFTSGVSLVIIRVLMAILEKKGVFFGHLQPLMNCVDL